MIYTSLHSTSLSLYPSLIDKHRKQVFSDDEITESMISKRVQGSTQWLVHISPSGLLIGLIPEAVIYITPSFIQRGEPIR